MINNVNMKVYKNYRLIFDGRETSGPDERYTTTEPIAQNDLLRVVIYESDLSIVGQVPYGFYLNSAKFQRQSDNCGVCQSTDMDSCQGGNSFCNVTTGVMTGCLPTKNNILVDVHSPACQTEKFQGFLMNGHCEPYECVDGYYYLDGHCRCIPGFRKSSTLICNANNVFIKATTDDLAEQQQQQQSPVVAAAVSAKGHWAVVLVLFLFLL